MDSQLPGSLFKKFFSFISPDCFFIPINTVIIAQLVYEQPADVEPAKLFACYVLPAGYITHTGVEPVFSPAAGEHNPAGYTD